MSSEEYRANAPFKGELTDKIVKFLLKSTVEVGGAITVAKGQPENTWKMCNCLKESSLRLKEPA